jgi:hypothetical protein
LGRYVNKPGSWSITSKKGTVTGNEAVFTPTPATAANITKFSALGEAKKGSDGGDESHSSGSQTASYDGEVVWEKDKDEISSPDKEKTRIKVTGDLNYNITLDAREGGSASATEKAVIKIVANNTEIGSSTILEKTLTLPTDGDNHEGPCQRNSQKTMRRRLCPSESISTFFAVTDVATPPRRSEEARLAFKIPACLRPRRVQPHYSPKYFRAIWMPSSYMLWNFPCNCSPRLVLREENSVTCAIGISRRRSSDSICVVDPTSINPSRS